MVKDRDKGKSKRKVMASKRSTVERLDEKKDQEQRLKRVKDMLDCPFEEGEAENEVTIEEANKALEEAGFNPEEIRLFARFLVAQEQEPFQLPARSPDHYTVIRDTLRELMVKLLGAGANVWTIKQSLEGRIDELTTLQHEARKQQTIDANNSSRFANPANREGILNSVEEETEED
jgi:hypothetical protein